MRCNYAAVPPNSDFPFRSENIIEFADLKYHYAAIMAIPLLPRE